MGVCCIKGNHTLNDYGQGAKKRPHSNHLMKKSIPKNHDSIFTAQTKSDMNRYGSKVESVEPNEDNLHHNNHTVSSIDKQHKFFTYFAHSSKAQLIVNEYIRQRRMGQKQQINKNDVKSQGQIPNQIYLKHKDDVGYSQADEKMIIEKEISFLIEEAKNYLDQLKSLIQSNFVAQLKKLQIAKKDTMISNSFLIKMVFQLNELCLKNNQIPPNENHLVGKIQEDLLQIILAGFVQKMEIPCKITPLSMMIQNFTADLNKSNPEDSVFDRSFNEHRTSFYLIKLKLSHFIDNLQKSNANISKISISLIQTDPKTKSQQQSELAFIDPKKLTSIHQIEFFITSNTIIKFKTYPIQSTLTLHAPEFLKFIYVDQTFAFVKKTSNNPKYENNQQMTGPIEIIASIRLNIQIFSSNWSDSLNKLKLQTKNIVNELQSVQKGQNTWDHMNSLKSSFASVSQNESSFISNFDSSGFCC